MSKKIFKYPLTNTDTQIVEMPRGAEILCIQTQNETPCIWALVDPSETVIPRAFEIFGTRHSVDKNINHKYIGTYQLQGGKLVFHCFEFLGFN